MLDSELLERIACYNTRWASSSVAAAHSAMQVHLDCSVGECAAKTAAHRRLTEAGMMAPDSGRTNHLRLSSEHEA